MSLGPAVGGGIVSGGEFHEYLGHARIGVHIAAAKITGGHAMGYEPDSLCGNIVNCRLGLEGAQQALEAILWLREHAQDRIPPAVLAPLVPEVRRVIEAVDARIADLRARVWW